MHIPATLDQARSTLAVMLGIAATEGMPTEIDHETIAAATRYIFHLEPQFGLAGLTPLSPYRQAELAEDPALAAQAVSFAAVMALVEGTINPAKLSGVVKLADSLGVKDEFVHDLARIALGDLKDAKAHMLLANLESVTGRTWTADEMGPWLQPYGAEPDPALARRFHALARLPDNTFGHAFATFYQANGYAYPGEPTALNFEFAVPHDSTHVLAGYDTSPRGELMTSTLTATMHRVNAMSGHVLPVMLSWHLGIPLNDVAGAATGAFEPQEFFYAWARGEDTTADLFAPAWDFWSAAIQPIDAVREEVGLFADDET
ncbi:hypothetical protein [Afipia sp. DC4300-2b1]|uniref:hypothetical protein n=1 Tax=Afipia sp. DC4300-2b1 TaxID=2804672 RepID=UPI003CF04BEA